MTKSKIVFEELEELYGQFHIFGQEWVDSADVKAVTKARHRAKLVIKAMKSFVETTISEESRLLAEEVQRLEEEISEETEEQNEQDEHEHDHGHEHHHGHKVHVDVPESMVVEVVPVVKKDFGSFSSPEVTLPSDME